VNSSLSKSYGVHETGSTPVYYGSEYVNSAVVKLLNKLLIEFTKSRARRTNDQALVEGKNGSIIRK